MPAMRGEPLWAFLDPAGVILCFDLDSVAPAAERLRQRRAANAAPRAPTALEQRLAGEPANLPLRGAVVEQHGEIAQLLSWLAPRADPSEWKQAWDPIESATLAGRFTSAAGIALTLELVVNPATDGPRRERLLADLQRYFDEQWETGKVSVHPRAQGMTVDLLVDELPRRFETMRGDDSRAARTEPADPDLPVSQPTPRPGAR
jgi:hypothetical protein